MVVRIALSIGILAALAFCQEGESPATPSFLFLEEFDSGSIEPFVKSGSSKYSGQQVSVKDGSILFKDANKHYGVSAPLPAAVVTKDESFVFQYEVELTEGLQCGGAYVKLLKAEGDMDPTKLDNESPYVIMFGPDSCGDTNKVHFILRHQNPVSGEWEEKHAENVPAPKKDKKSHLYTLVVRPDNSFEIFIDLESKAKGSLLKDMEPPVNPPKEIDDPTDSKPEDWVDVKKIKDPEAKKPDDWDETAPKKIPDESASMPSDWLEDEPDMVPDPSAEQPEDWDEDEDGDWEAPVIANPKCAKVSGCGEWKRPEIDNPAYKGKWSAPMIDNPEYKGEWKAKQIENPNFFEDPHPHNIADIGAVAVEIWTTNAGIKMDNFIVDKDEAAVKAYGKNTWGVKKAAQDAESKSEAKQKAKEEREEKRAAGGISNMIEVYLGDAMDLAAENPIPAVITAIVLLASLIFLCSGSSSKPKPAVAQTSATASTEEKEETTVTPDDAKAEEDADEDGDTKGKRAKKRTPKAE